MHPVELWIPDHNVKQVSVQKQRNTHYHNRKHNTQHQKTKYLNKLVSDMCLTIEIQLRKLIHLI
jgi:hypothetical protein